MDLLRLIHIQCQQMRRWQVLSAPWNQQRCTSWGATAADKFHLRDREPLVHQRSSKRLFCITKRLHMSLFESLTLHLVLEILRPQTAGTWWCWPVPKKKENTVGNSKYLAIPIRQASSGNFLCMNFGIDSCVSKVLCLEGEQIKNHDSCLNWIDIHRYITANKFKRTEGGTTKLWKFWWREVCQQNNLPRGYHFSTASLVLHRIYGGAASQQLQTNVLQAVAILSNPFGKKMQAERRVAA